MSRRSLALLVALPLAALACQDDPTTTTSPDARPGLTATGQQVDVIVQLDREFAPGRHVDNKDRAAAIARDLGVEPRYTYGTALFGFAGPVAEGRIGALERDPRVVVIERDHPVHAIEQTLQNGVDRIQVDQNSTANIDNTDDAMDADIGIIDTGIDLDHPDLDVQAGKDCIDDGKDTTNDDNGHGTHVAGTAGAIDNTSHVVGAAPGARVHAIKVLDSGGSGTISSVICGVDYVTNNASTFEVANMSLGAQDSSSTFRTSIQNSVDAGVFYAVAAGNDASDVYGSDGTFGTDDDFIPAAYPEVATVSAMADFDGSSGGDAGSLLFTGCGKIDDDTFAECFSNFSQSVVSTNPVSSPGAAIDVAAPGVSVLSTTNDGDTGNKSGTSMSSPHVAGTAALYIVQHGLSPSSASDVHSIRQALIDNGQAQSNWQSGDVGDPDSNPEPLVQAVFDSDSPPSVSITNPSDGDTVAGEVTVTADASDDDGVDQVEFFVDGGSIGTDSDGSDGWSTAWSTTDYSDGDHTVTAEATDTSGQTSSDQITVTVDNTDDPPSVTLTNPSEGETVSGTIDLTADASDDGSVSQVEFFVDGSSVGTDSDGSDGWSVSWDSNNVSDGDHTATAEATDDAGQTSSDSNGFTVDNSIGMHVGDLDGSSLNGGPTWDAVVTITVHDGSHNTVADATVSGTWSGIGGGTVQNNSCTTDSTGQCTVRVNGMHKRNGSVSYTVDDVTHSSLTYDSSANHDPDGDSDGTTITVQKP